MLNETYRGMLGHKSVIRETFMYGKQRAAQIGYENVFDYSLGNPSVPCPERFTAAMQELLTQEDPVALHGYCPSQGDPEFRTAVAAHLNRTFGLPYAQKDIFPTTGAAGAIAHALRAVTRPGDEVLTFAPYFPEYGPYVEGTGAHLRVVPPQAPGPGKEHPARLLVHGVAQPVHGVGLQCPVVEHQVRPVQAHIIQRPVWGDLFPQLPGQLHQNIRTKAAVCIRRWHILSPPFRTRISIAESHPRRHPSGSDLCKIFEIFFITPIP